MDPSSYLGEGRLLCSGGGLGLLGGLLLLEVLGEELLVGDVGLLGLLPVLSLVSLVDDLSSDSLLGDQSLHLGRLVEGLVSLLDLSSHDVLGHIILGSEGEGLSDGRSSLGSESSGSDGVGETLDLAGALDEDLEGDHGQIGSADAASDRLSLSLSVSSGPVEGGS